MSDSDVRQCCPECGSVEWWRRTGGDLHNPDDEAPENEYRCKECPAEFDVLDERELEHVGGGSTLAKTLSDLNADEVPGLGGESA